MPGDNPVPATRQITHHKVANELLQGPLPRKDREQYWER